MNNLKYRYPTEKYKRAGIRGNPLCPICGKDWCGYNSYLCSCMRISHGSFKTVIQRNGQPCYLHWLKPGMTHLQHEDETVVTVGIASLERRDRVYKDFLSLLSLSPHHRQGLQRRGLSDWEIKKNGYKTIPDNEKPWEICHRLIDRGHDLIGIPGFYKAQGPYGTYWTFSRQPGYFIPVRDTGDCIQTLQRRMDKCSSGKYKIFSASNNESGCSSGTPAHVAKPTKIKDNRIWISEGPLKSDIASKYLGATVIGALSAAAWRPVIKIIDKLIREHEVTEAVLAYDKDYETNPLVGEPLRMLTEELKQFGLSLYQACWENGKGIDDALVAGTKIYYRSV